MKKIYFNSWFNVARKMKILCISSDSSDEEIDGQEKLIENKKFRINSKYLFLTYSQLDLTPLEALNQLTEILNAKKSKLSVLNQLP